MNSNEWDDRYQAADRLWSAGPNLFVADRLATTSPGVGLDLASGEGSNSIWLADKGWSMTAVDFSEVAVERGRRVSTTVEFVVADVLSWEPERSFDLVLLAYLQLVESDLRLVVEQSVEWLMPGGEIFLIGHDRSNIEKGYGGPQAPEILWDVETIVSWLDDLEVVEAQVVRRPVEVDGEILLARDTLVRARAAPGQTEPS